MLHLNGNSTWNGNSTYGDEYKTQPWIVNQADVFYYMDRQI